MDRFDPFVKYADVYGDIINWEKDPMNKPQNQNKYFFSDGKTYYEQICKMLRLMSVFKEAFNQIYSNEDEISEAWENFVNNLSASVVEGSEPDVTLTWTDDSVNFEFTMVPGVPGEQGVGIASISFNSDYTMTITLSDGNTYTSMSLKGETGPQGPQGETGSGLQILDVYATLADLQSAHPTGQPGDAYQVGSEGNYILYIWSSSQSAWVQAGTIGTVSPYTSAPLMDGTASAGSQNLYSRGDHVHPTDTSRASKEELDALIKTSQALIDQSFTYRESPAIQDGLARIDMIKGNTLVWNQQLDISIVSSSSVINGITYDRQTDEIKATGTASADSTLFISGSNYNIYNFINGHTYYLKGCPSGGSSSTYYMSWSLSGSDYGNGRIAKATSDITGYVYARIISGVTVNNLSFKPQLFDLTLMGIDDLTTPTQVEEWLSTHIGLLPYYSYNQGSLLSFMGNGIKTVGFNQWDEEWELGGLNASTGALWNTTDRIRSKNFIDIEPSASYFIHYPTSGFSVNYCFYDGDKNFISSGTNVNTVITTLTNARYMKFATYTQYGTTYKNDICINISDTERNGEYEPYTSSTLSLPISTYFPTGMKSAGNVYDELTESKAITRIGRVDLGSLNWLLERENYNVFLAGVQSYIKPPVDNNTVANIKCALYSSDTNNNVYSYNVDKAISVSSGGALRIRDTSFSDANTFKNAMSGVYLYYELATPTEASVDLDLSFISYEGGTEQLLPVNASVPSTSPIIADMTYLSIDDAMEYIIDKLANVPLNTQQILDSLEDDVADLQTYVSALQPAVSALQTSVGNINTNIGQLSSTVAGHTASISDMQSDITDLNTGLSDLEDTVTDNTSRIGTLESGLSATNGNVQSLSSQVQSIDGRVTNLESDLFKIVVKEFDYDTVAPETNFGTTTPITQEEGYRVIGVVGTEAQAGEYTSPASNIAITQCHIYYTSLGALTITIFGRNNDASSRTNVRIYAYLLCIKDIQ